MPKRKIKSLPPKLRAELDRRLVKGGFSNYRALARWLGEQGCAISHSGVHKYGQELERRLETVRLATEQARAVVDATGEAGDTVNEGLMRLVQGDLFSVLFALKDVDRKNIDLNQLARHVASICRASVQMRKLADEMRHGIGRRVRDAERKVVEAARRGARGGLSQAAERRIRAALLEIAELPAPADDSLPAALRMFSSNDQPEEPADPNHAESSAVPADTNQAAR
jgi:Protein of unknown function (DUF3486)